MIPHINPRITAMWTSAAHTVLTLAPQMHPDLVNSLAQGLGSYHRPETPPPAPTPEPQPASLITDADEPPPAAEKQPPLRRKTPGALDSRQRAVNTPHATTGFPQSRAVADGQSSEPASDFSNSGRGDERFSQLIVQIKIGAAPVLRGRIFRPADQPCRQTKHNPTVAARVSPRPPTPHEHCPPLIRRAVAFPPTPKPQPRGPTMSEVVATIDGIHYEITANPSTRGATLSVGIGTEIQLDARLTRAELIALTQALISVIKWRPIASPGKGTTRHP